jgi:YaiO family outer membrane protein
VLLTLTAALLVTTALQSSAPDRTRAEQLARAGQTTEAIELFKHILEQDPADTDARLWVARLDLRLGNTEAAEAAFRSVLREHPADIDAMVGLGTALTRKGEIREALGVLREAERGAGKNADLFSALARAYRRAGDDRSALAYFEQAKAIAPSDPDIITGYEAVAHAYGHSLVFDGFAEHLDPDSNTASGSLIATIRVMPKLHLRAAGRVQNRAGSSDTQAGGGLLWRAARATTVGFNALGGSGNTSLPTSDFSGDVIHYAGAFEVGFGLRDLSFAGADVTAASPVFAWDQDRWRTDGRYTYSRSRFDATGESSGDHSVMLRETWRGWRRVWLNAVYAYGIESFEELTADRLSTLGSTTIATGVQIRMPSLTAITTTWEHQWRSNDSSVDRLTLTIVQAFP